MDLCCSSINLVVGAPVAYLKDDGTRRVVSTLVQRPLCGTAPIPRDVDTISAANAPHEATLGVLCHGGFQLINC